MRSGPQRDIRVRDWLVVGIGVGGAAAITCGLPDRTFALPSSSTRKLKLISRSISFTGNSTISPGPPRSPAEGLILISI